MKTEKQIFRQVIKTAGFLVILIVISGNFRILLGYLLGLVISVLMFLRIASTTKKALKMSQSRAKSYITLQYIIRFIINGATLYVAYQRKDFSFTGTVIGLLTIKIGITSWVGWQALVKIYNNKFRKIFESQKS